ncbi:hypothetical protein D3C76_1257640 [compost metagenome]
MRIPPVKAKDSVRRHSSSANSAHDQRVSWLTSDAAANWLPSSLRSSYLYEPPMVVMCESLKNDTCELSTVFSSSIRRPGFSIFSRWM